jgi:TolB-like protein/class 3 adenylate cyclase
MKSPPEERRLTTILAADVVGYSRLMGEDESGTLSALKAHRAELIDPKAAQYNGRTIKLMGDGALMEFPSVVEAVTFAVEVQLAIAERNREVPEDRRIVYRIGINIGDVIVEGDDIYGDGVNIAARLEALAEPGGICVRRNVRNQIRDKLDLDFEDLGEIEVKNIARQVRTFRVVLDEKAEALATPVIEDFTKRGTRYRPVAAAAIVMLLLVVGGTLWWRPWAPQLTELPDQPSIAVLSFDNFSGDPALDYFSDGVSEDIITMLSRFPDLAVISRNSSFVYKGKATDIRQIGKELGAAYVLEGSVRKQADKIRLTAQLIEAVSGEHVWAERYDEEGTDPWALQDDVIAKIVDSLTGEEGQLKQAEYKRTWGKDSGSLEEYDYYLRGHELFITAETKDVHEQAGAIWAEGLRKFPNSSLLRVKLALYHLGLVWGYWSEDPVASIQQAERLVQEAFSSPALSPQARRLGHWGMAWAQQMKGDLPRALEEAKAAIALAPYDTYMVGDLAGILAMAGEPGDAVALLENLRSRSPNFQDHWDLAVAYYLVGDDERAVQAALEIRLGSLDRYVLLASSYVRLGQIDEARAAIEKLLELNPQFTQDDFKDNYLYSDPSIMQRQAADLGKAGLPEK